MKTAKTIRQLDVWRSDFGKQYTDRHWMTGGEWDDKFGREWGIKMSDLFCEFLRPGTLAGGRLLEVGCNIGMQLEILHGLYPDLRNHFLS